MKMPTPMTPLMTSATAAGRPSCLFSSTCSGILGYRKNFTPRRKGAKKNAQLSGAFLPWRAFLRAFASLREILFSSLSLGPGARLVHRTDDGRGELVGLGLAADVARADLALRED